MVMRASPVRTRITPPPDTNAHFGSRLCFKSEALADYAAETFKELYEDYLMFK